MLRRRMRRCKMLLFVVTAQSAKSKWMPWELGFFDAARGTIVVYPVDAAAEQRAKGQVYLSLYDIVAPGSIVREIAAKLSVAERFLPEAEMSTEALKVIQRNAVDTIFGRGDFGATNEYGQRIAQVARTPLDVSQFMKLQSDMARAWWQLWLGMFLEER